MLERGYFEVLAVRHPTERNERWRNVLATRDLTFLSTFYSVNAVAMVAAFQAVERIFGGGLKAAWGCMLAFQLGRLAAFGLRLRGARGSEVVTKS